VFVRCVSQNTLYTTILNYFCPLRDSLRKKRLDASVLIAVAITHANVTSGRIVRVSQALFFIDSIHKTVV
jgi:hypothetical protein